MKSLNQLENKSLRERVLDSLRAAIINGDLRPGEELVEAELAAQLGVSRAPLREAIRILNVEGLLHTVSYHGTSVKALSRKDIEELYSVRSMMEVFAIQHIIEAENLTDIVADLHNICNAMLESAERDSLDDVNWIDQQFHDALIQHTNNDLLSMLWNSVSIRVQQVMALRNQQQDDLAQIGKNHQAIVDAIASKDSETAVRLICEHIGTTGDAIVNGWEDEQTDG